MKSVDAPYVKSAAARLGADLCGIAPVARFENAPEGFHPQDILRGSKSVAVLAARFPRSCLRSSSPIPYTFARNMMVHKMDSISFRLCEDLEACGIDSVSVPASDPYEYWDPARRHGRGILSLKHAGQIAGLGKIGKNTLLVNETYGNMIWMSAVLVSEELEADRLADYEPCMPGCSLCLEACPAGALDGVTIDQRRCRERSNRCTEGGGFYLSCHECRTVCPNHLGLVRTREE
ncbi:MAG: epoxyqueuosine reductase [Firmicutes bacterium]|nr:epoxyqueuosine reductase [Bacillota bacterium]